MNILRLCLLLVIPLLVVSAEAVVFVPEYEPSNEWTAEYREAFVYALQMWEATLAGPMAIHVRVRFQSLGGDVVGGAYPTLRRYRNVDGDIEATVVALHGHLTGDFTPALSTDNLVDPGDAGFHITIIFNRDRDWYIGPEGRPSGSQADFITTALHELSGVKNFL